MSPVLFYPHPAEFFLPHVQHMTHLLRNCLRLGSWGSRLWDRGDHAESVLGCAPGTNPCGGKRKRQDWAEGKVGCDAVATEASAAPTGKEDSSEYPTLGWEGQIYASLGGRVSGYGLLQARQLCSAKAIPKKGWEGDLDGDWQSVVQDHLGFWLFYLMSLRTQRSQDVLWLYFSVEENEKEQKEGERMSWRQEWSWGQVSSGSE